MRIGISIDGVLRDIFLQIENTFIKYFGSEDDPMVEVKDYDFNKWLVFPEEEVKQGEMIFDPDFKETEFIESGESVELVKVTKRVTVEEFLYEKCTLEVFGYGNEVISSAVQTVNQLIIDNPQHEFILISREGGLAIPSTLFFLAKTKSTCSNIKFVTEYSKVWSLVDIMVTDHPNIIESKPDDKICVVIEKDFNDGVGTPNLKIKTIKEFDSLSISNLIN